MNRLTTLTTVEKHKLNKAHYAWTTAINAIFMIGERRYKLHLINKQTFH